MSDNTPTPEPSAAPSSTPETTAAAPPAYASSTPSAPKPKSGLPLAALIVGIVAIVFALIPGLSFFAFIPALTALGLGIAGLASKAPGRGKALTGLILGPVALLVAIIVSVTAIAGGVRQTVDQADSAPAVEEESSAAPEPEPVEEAPEAGTRENPSAAGSTIEISDNSGPIWEVTIGAANLNAGDIIAAENQFNPAADAGFQYILVPVTYTYVGSTSGTPWIDVTIEYVSAAGTTHTQQFVVAPNQISDINEMYAGASATGNLVIMAPVADIEKGAFAISTLFGAPYFVKVV